MSRCPHCGQERGEPTIAHYRDMGFDPLDHCLFTMLHEERIEPCVGKSPKIGRQCELCPRSKKYGRWEVSRGRQTFIPTKEEKDANDPERQQDHPPVPVSS